MAKKNLMTRFEEAQIEALKAIADKNGTDISQVVRWAVDALIALYQKNGGRLILPLDFSGRYEILDRAATPASKPDPKISTLTLPQRAAETPAPTPSKLKPIKTRQNLPPGQ